LSTWINKTAIIRKYQQQTREMINYNDIAIMATGEEVIRKITMYLTISPVKKS
jgi:hypothetical protein